MDGTADTSVRTRAVAVVSTAVALCGVLTGVAAAAPGPDKRTTTPASGRILYAGTGHRSLGVVAAPVAGRPAVSRPLLDERPAHYDDQPAARGDLVVFTSRRDSPRPQVYLRDPAGKVHRLTDGRDAGHPTLSPDRRFVVFDSAEPRPNGTGTQRDLWLVRTDGTASRRLTDTAADEIAPTVSPDGTRIAFASDRDGRWEIYLRPLAGGTARRLTNEPDGAAAEQPAWNPVDDAAHRDRIAYTVDLGAGHTPRLVLRIADGERTDIPVLGGAQRDWQGSEPAWKPDGDGLLFLSPNRLCGCQSDVDAVYEVDVTAGVPATCTPILLLDENRSVGSPTWLVDRPGGSLVIAHTTEGDPHTATLQDVRPDGSDPRDLGLTVLREDPDSDTDPDRLFHPRPGFDPWTERQNYSPDGRRIAVSRFTDDPSAPGGRTQRIWLVNADGSDPAPLPVADRSPTDWETDATWSPDGRLIAFTRRSPGGLPGHGAASRIVVVDVATGTVVGKLPTPAGQDGLDDAQPVWSPDGRTLAFTRVTRIAGSTANKHIWTARWRAATGVFDDERDLSAAVCRSDCAVIDDSPAFSPNGRDIAFNRKDDAVLLAARSGTTCRVLLPVGASTCGEPVTAPKGPFQPRDVAFSPEGTRVVLSTRRTGAPASPEGLAIVDVRTGRLTPLDWALPGRQKEPSWQQTVDLTVTAPRTTATGVPGVRIPVTVTVTNHGPAPAPHTTLSVVAPAGLRVGDLRPERGHCVADRLRCDLGTLPPGAAVHTEVDLVAVDIGTRLVHWVASGAVLDARPADNVADTRVIVRAAPPSPSPPPGPSPSPPPGAPPSPTPGPSPSPTSGPPPSPTPGPPRPAPLAEPSLGMAVTPTPAFVGGPAAVTYTVRNNGGSTATGLRLDLGLPAGVPVTSIPSECTATRCSLANLPPGGARVVRVILTPVAPLRARVRGTLTTTGADTDPADNVAAAELRVLQPRIVAVPAVGEPGFVTLVRGVDFPPGAPVRLTWSPGITAAAAPTRPGRDGRFTAQLLILAKDQTGPRTITASGPGFGPVTTPFLVVAGTASPPDLIGRR